MTSLVVVEYIFMHFLRNDDYSEEQSSSTRYRVSSYFLFTATLTVLFGHLFRLHLSTLEFHDLPLRL